MKKERFISVTHFINPQLFWFHTIDVPNEGFLEIMKMERQLHQIFREKKANQNFRPLIGDIVGIRFLSWNKFIRGRVEAITEYRNMTTAFVIWAIDYGFPFKTNLQHIRRMPVQYTEHMNHIQCGSLAYILPAEKEFVFMDSTTKIMRKECWSQHACDSLEKLITDASSITFVGYYQTTPTHFWGDLKIVNDKGVSFLASNYLISTDVAIESRLNFREICLSLETIKLLCWLSNNGDSKFKNNVASSAPGSGTFIRASDNTCDDFSKRKVEDWHAQNEQVDGAGRSTPTAISTDYCVDNCELFVDEIKYSPSTHKENLRLCGRLTMNKINVELDPPPDSALKINPPGIELQDDLGKEMSDTTSNADCSATGRSLSSRLRRLLEIRRKSMLTEALENSTSQPSTEMVSNVGISDNLYLPKESLDDADHSVFPMPLQLTRMLEFRKKTLAEDAAEKEAKLKCSESIEAREFVVANLYSGNEIVKNVSVQNKSDETPAQEPRGSSRRSRFYKELFSAEKTGSSSEWNFPQKEFPKDVTEKNQRAQLDQSQTWDDEIQGTKFPDSTKDKLNNNLRISNQKSCAPFDGIKLLPAGFDLARVNTDNDEKNHWHRKKSTHQDLVAYGSCIPRDTNLFFDAWNPQLRDESNGEGWSDVSNQNFRHIRAHIDKHKEEDREDPPTKKQNDTAAPKIREEVLKPIISGEVKNQTEVQHVDVTDCNTISFDSAIKYRSPRIFSHWKRLKEHSQFKSPAQRMDKIEQLVRHVELEKEWGNTQILNLSALNLNSKSDPDSTDLIETSRPAYAIAEMPKENEINPAGDQEKFDKHAKQLLEPMKPKTQIRGEIGGEKIQTSTAKTLPQQQKIRSKIGKKKIQTSAVRTHPQAPQIHGKSTPQEQQIRNINGEEKAQTSTAITVPQTQDIHNATNREKIRISNVIFPQAEEIHNISDEKKIETKFIGHMVLAHSKIRQYLLEKLSEANFLSEIYEEMIRMHATKVYRLQKFSWLHLLRGNSLVVINASRSGKTWSYLPSVCNLVAVRIRKCAVPQTYGPVAIILVASSAHAEKVTNFCSRLVKNVKPTITVVTSYGVRNRSEAKIHLLNSCGILVVTPANMLRVFNDNEHECLIDPKRVQHFVIDDLDLILSRSKQDFEAVMSTFYKVFKKSKNHTLTLQLVVTSRDWEATMIPMIKCSNQPLLLIGDFLEAAVYGKAVISIKLRSNEKKLAYVQKFIWKYFANRERFIIICNNDDDLEEVTRALNFSGCVCIGYGSRIGHEATDLRATINEWNKSKTSEVICCCDAALPELQLQNAQNLIHYSMPDSWTKFTARFATVAHSYTDYVSNDFKQCTSSKNTDKPVRSVVLLDEENNAQLPRLLEFMKKHNQIKNIHPNILAMAKRIMEDREELRSLEGIQLCPFVLEFGECDDARCDKRHGITKCDAITSRDCVPTTGDMRIKILQVFSPTYYSAYLLEYKTSHSSEWRELRCPNETIAFGVKLKMHYTNMENCVPLWPIKPNDLCVCKRDDNTFHRARILDAPKTDNTNIYYKSVRVTIKLIDLDTTIHNFISYNLFVCAKEFADFPALAVDIRLAGVVPYDSERSWDSKSTKAVRNWILTDINENECVHVNIYSALAHTVWVNNVIVMERLPTIGHYIYRVNVKRSLVEKGFGVIDNKVQTKLLALKEVCRHEELTEFTKDETGAECISPQAQKIVKLNAKINSNSLKQKETWCSLPLLRLVGVEIGDEKENCNWTNIYLRRMDEPYRQQFEDLKIIINDHIRSVRAAGVGRLKYDVSTLEQNCLVRYGSLFCRAKLDRIFGNERGQQIFSFFLCDYACFVTVDDDENFCDFLYETTPQIVEYTPYQAVHCKLAGINIKDSSSRHCVVKKYLYACAVRERNAAQQEMDDFQIRSYDILLYECEKKNDFNAKTLYNQTLLEYGIAEPDSKTRDLLEITPLLPDAKDETDLKNSKSGEEGEVFNFEKFLEICDNISKVEQEDGSVRWT